MLTDTKIIELYITHRGYPTEFARAIEAEVKAEKCEPVAWNPIETAPKDNKRMLYLARLNADGSIQSFDSAITGKEQP